MESDVEPLPANKPANSHAKAAQAELLLVSVTKRVTVIQINNSISIAL